jgi:tetratricopeptide (TPR) repeat protein
MASTQNSVHVPKDISRAELVPFKEALLKYHEIKGTDGLRSSNRAVFVQAVKDCTEQFGDSPGDDWFKGYFETKGKERHNRDKLALYKKLKRFYEESIGKEEKDGESEDEVHEISFWKKVSLWLTTNKMIVITGVVALFFVGYEIYDRSNRTGTVSTVKNHPTPHIVETPKDEGVQNNRRPIFEEKGDFNPRYRILVCRLGIRDSETSIDNGTKVFKVLDSLHKVDSKGVYDVKYLSLTDEELDSLYAKEENVMNLRKFHNADMIIVSVAVPKDCPITMSGEFCVGYECELWAYSTRAKIFIEDELLRSQSELASEQFMGSLEQNCLKLASISCLANMKPYVNQAQAKQAIHYTSTFADTDPIGHLIKAKAYTYMEDSILALKEYSEVINTDPEYSEAYTERAALRETENEIFLDYSNAMLFDPNSYQAYYNRGETNVRFGYIQRAISDFEKALNLITPSDTLKSNFLKMQIQGLQQGKGLIKLETIEFGDGITF